MTEPHLPQGYSIRCKTAQKGWQWFDLFFVMAFGFLSIAFFFLSIGVMLLGNLGFGLLFSSILVLWIWLFRGVIQAINDGRRQKWVVSFKGGDVGEARILRMKNYVSLNTLKVEANHKRRGLGTALVKRVISEVDQPIYLVCTPDLETFYRRLGFVAVIRASMGLRMKRSATVSTMGLEDLDKMQLPEGYTVDVLQGRAKCKAQAFLLGQWWIGSFYLKGISLIFLLVGLLNAFILMPSFHGQEWNNLDSLLILIWMQVSFLVFPLAMFSFSDFPAHPFLAIRSQRKTLISTYLWWGIDSAKLYLFCANHTGEVKDLVTALIQHVAKVVDVPVFLVCDRQYCDFYVQIGFQPVAKHKLPFILKVTSRASGVGMCYPIQS
jgi:N-acetylglutamate synthase-like GNAT family acetyltransferase